MCVAGSADTVRDVRGFATKFYTDEGNFDLVGNNIPVFFIQDAIKVCHLMYFAMEFICSNANALCQFPDVIHAGKPEPHNEMPQAQTAHDNFWDFISLTPESAHMVMYGKRKINRIIEIDGHFISSRVSVRRWTMSDRSIPRSYRMMEGFGVHTFALVNEKGIELYFSLSLFLNVLLLR
jgi:catalase